MRPRCTLLAAVALVVLLSSPCWGAHTTTFTGRGDSTNDPLFEDSHPEVKPALAPRGKHFSWHSSWQRGKKVTVLSIEPDTLRDRRSVLRHNATKHNVRHRHGATSNQTNNKNSNNNGNNQERDRHQEVHDRPTFVLMPRKTNKIKVNDVPDYKPPLRGKTGQWDSNMLRDFHNYVNKMPEDKNDNLITAKENTFSPMKKHISDQSKDFQFDETELDQDSKRYGKSRRSSQSHSERPDSDTGQFLAQQKYLPSHEDHEIRGLLKTSIVKNKFGVNNNTGNRKIFGTSIENVKNVVKKENDGGKFVGELLEFLERKRRDDGVRNIANKNERIRRRRARRRSRIEKRRQRRRERKKLRKRPIGIGDRVQGDQPPQTGSVENRRNERERSGEGRTRNPSRDARRRQRIAERRKRRKQRRLRRRGKENRGRSLDVALAGLKQDNKSLLNGSNACQFRDLLRCARETFALDADPKPADTIPRCKQRKSFLTCMQQQRTNRGDCSPSVKARGDLHALRKYIRDAMFTNSSCIIAESITG